MIFLFSMYLFFISWLTIYKYNTYKRKGILKNECIKKYNNRLLVSIIFSFVVVMLLNVLQGIGLVNEFIESTNGEYFNLPENLTGEWEKYIDIGFVGYLFLKLPGKIFQFILRTVFVVCSMFIFHSRYLLRKDIMLPKYLVITVYILSILNGFYMFSELFDLLQTGGEILWFMKNIF